MEFAIFAARVCAGRQCIKQRVVKAPAGKRSWQLPEINGGKMRFQPSIDHFACERRSRPSPYREHRCNADTRKVPLAIGPHVLEKKVTENHVRDPRRASLVHRRRHFLLINFIRARKWNVQHDRWQTSSVELGPQ